MATDFSKLLPAEVLPHRDSLLLLTDVVCYEEGALEARAVLDPASLLGEAVGSQAPALVAVEMAAQAAAFHASVGNIDAGADPAEKGYLVRLRRVELKQPRLLAGVAVLVRTRRVGGAGGLAMYQFSCEQEGVEAARGQLSILRG